MSRSSRTRVGVFVAVSVLFLVAGAVMAADTLAVSEHQSPEMIEVENSSNYLSPPAENVTRQQYETADLDVSGAIAADAARLQGDKERNRVEYELTRAAEPAEVAEELIAPIEHDVARLETKQRHLVQNHSAGDISDGTFVREVVRHEATAQQYRSIAEHVREEVALPDALGTRYGNLRGEIPLLPAPLSEQLDRATTGEVDPTQVYIQSSPNSFVLGTVVDETYVRQAVLFDQRDRAADDQFVLDSRAAPEAAFSRGASLYPWANNDNFGPNIQGFGTSSVYLFSSSHSHGELRSYLDGGTTNPFYEYQQKNALSVPVTQFTQDTNNGLRLTVESTAPTGPMRIQVLGTGDTELSDIDVSINGQTLVRIDDGEDFWTIQPVGTFEVTATTPEGESVTVTVTVS